MRKYQKKILKEAGRIDKAGVWHLTVQHDRRCGIFSKSGVCTCNPTVGKAKLGKNADHD